MANWRPAYSLQTLKDQLDAAYPGWAFLGFIGDQSHTSVASDHNPNAQGVVTALDIGAGGGLKIHDLAENIRANPHPDAKYIISNYRIAGPFTDWNWGYYNGIDPHDTHIHVSVGRGPDGESVQPYDDRVQWDIKGGEEMPNAGDVINVFRDALGRNPNAGEINAYTASTWNNLYYTLYTSKEYRDQTYVNDGDIQNLFKTFAGRDASNADKVFHRGNKFKQTIYNLMKTPDILAHQSGGEYTPVTEQLFKKK